jgi:hypothetical protein
MGFGSARQSRLRCVLATSLVWALGVLGTCAYSAAVAAPEDAAGNCEDVTLPKDIHDTLGRRFAGWKIQLSRDLLPDARKIWAATTPLVCPGVASGHFADSKTVSYALLLVPTDKSVTGYQLVTFTAPPKHDFYGYKLLDQADTDAGTKFIVAAAIERVFDKDTQKKLRPKTSDAVALVQTDAKPAAQTVFFWTGESYGSVPMSF